MGRAGRPVEFLGVPRSGLVAVSEELRGTEEPEELLVARNVT
jgi:hypothetical protein